MRFSDSLWHALTTCNPCVRGGMAVALSRTMKHLLMTLIASALFIFSAGCDSIGQCAAVPTCDRDDIQLGNESAECPTGASCYMRTMCGDTITCEATGMAMADAGVDAGG